MREGNTPLSIPGRQLFSNGQQTIVSHIPLLKGNNASIFAPDPGGGGSDSVVSCCLSNDFGNELSENRLCFGIVWCCER